MSTTNKDKNIIIVGGGFGGVRAALNLSGLVKKNKDVHVTLISDVSHFEYKPALYRSVTGRSPIETCIPLRIIFDGKDVDVIEDVIKEVDLVHRTIIGKEGSAFRYDKLILALGSETSFFGIEGLSDRAYQFKTVCDAIILKCHLHQLFKLCKLRDVDEVHDDLRVVVIGGGASGTELAGELSEYMQKLTQLHGVESCSPSVTLIETGSRILPLMPKKVSDVASKRLKHLGVKILTNTKVARVEQNGVMINDKLVQADTVVWTAGVVPNKLYSKIEGVTVDNRGRVLVDKLLRIEDERDVYIIGDASSTPYAGMAQTAEYDANFVSESIIAEFENADFKEKYKPKKPIYAIPVGQHWAVVALPFITIYGLVGSWLRRVADFRFFLSILPITKALQVFWSGQQLCESCPVCSTEELYK